MSLPMFFARRFTRVYPALVVFIVVMGPLWWAISHENTMSASILALTLTINYAIFYGFPFTIFDHIWSLCVEEHSYLLLGLIAFALRKSSRVVAASAVLVGSAAMVNGIVRLDVFGYNTAPTIWRTDVAMAPIFISAAFFMLSTLDEDRDYWKWLTPVAAAGAVLTWFSGPNAAVYYGCSIIFLAIAITGVDRSVLPFRAILESRTLRFLGQCSFSIYLWQEFFYKLNVGVLPPVIMLFAAICCGIAAYYLVERPLRLVFHAIFFRRVKAPAVSG
jgi:peptidoglycan/LPS O-acetylase OafA/YrhL